MADKTELQLKVLDTRTSALERALDGVKKAGQGDTVARAEFKALLDRMTKLETSVQKLETSLNGKADKKTAEQLAEAQAAKQEASAKKQAADLELSIRKQVKQMEQENAKVQADVAKTIFEQRMTILDARLKALEGRAH